MLRGALLATFAGVALACGDGPSDPCEDPVSFASTIRPEVTLPYCEGCHASTPSGVARNGAPAGYDFDDPQRVSALAFELANAITSGTMPPSRYSAPSAAERERVVEWRRCGYAP